LPLAIELISARVKLLPPATLLERLHGRLMLQSDGLRDIEPRHRTLNNAIDWSYQLLSTEEQIFFRRLGVFVGGWTLEAASAICMDKLSLNLLDGLASLLDKSLIKQATASDSEPRFMMLETIREYALACLTASGELDSLQRRHAAYFLVLAETDQSGMTGTQQASWWARMEVELANFRAAMTRSHTERSCDEELRLILALGDFWRLHGHLSEGIVWLTNALSRQVSEPVGALTKAERTLRAKALQLLAVFDQWRGSLDTGQPILEESLALYRELGDKASVAGMLGIYGMHFVLRDEPEQASLHLNESMALWRELNDSFGIALSLLFFGNLAYAQGNITQAGTMWEEALALYRPSNGIWVMATLLAQLAMVAVDQRNFEQARIQLAESLMILQEMGERWQIVHTLEVYACFIAVQAERLEDMRRAAQIFGAAEKLRETIASPVFPFQQRFNQRGLAALQAKHDDAAFREAWKEGRAMTLDQVVTYALEQVD
jgi:tetratricopeptide (TPR) repeat protein